MSVSSKLVILCNRDNVLDVCDQVVGVINGVIDESRQQGSMQNQSAFSHRFVTMTGKRFSDFMLHFKQDSSEYHTFMYYSSNDDILTELDVRFKNNFTHRVGLISACTKYHIELLKVIGKYLQELGYPVYINENDSDSEKYQAL